MNTDQSQISGIWSIIKRGRTLSLDHLGNTKKKLIALICLFVVGYSYSSSQAGEKIRIVPGGAINGNSPVKSIVIGTTGVGLSYTKRNKEFTDARRVAPAAAVRVSATGISEAFVLGEVYVYPNPAKGGQIPTFHIETGIADSVKITVYTVSGDVAHSYTIASQPNTINDGHGLEYAYEYAWRGHIPSGVYYYAIEAQKAGKKLRKNGKFAVIR